ncbi:hypothetical protein MNBD_GAMMA04-2360, partial [hydrothermal vent metagenome]
MTHISRRNLLKGSAITAAGATTGFAAIASASNHSEHKHSPSQQSKRVVI